MPKIRLEVFKTCRFEELYKDCNVVGKSARYGVAVVLSHGCIKFLFFYKVSNISCAYDGGHLTSPATPLPRSEIPNLHGYGNIFSLSSSPRKHDIVSTGVLLPCSVTWLEVPFLVQ